MTDAHKARLLERLRAKLARLRWLPTEGGVYLHEDDRPVHGGGGEPEAPEGNGTNGHEGEP